MDFESEDEVREYDEKYRKVRNSDLEAENISTAIGLTPGSVILETGTGTGETAIRLSGRCKKVYAYDVSLTMLSFASGKARNLGLENIESMHAGFLNHPMGPASCDAVITQLALHPLPDFRKSVALQGINSALKVGRMLCLPDSMLFSGIPEYEESIGRTLASARATVGEKLAAEVAVNIRDEFPTYNRILEEMIRRSGLKIIRKARYTDVMGMMLAKNRIDEGGERPLNVYWATW